MAVMQRGSVNTESSMRGNLSVCWLASLALAAVAGCDTRAANPALSAPAPVAAAPDPTPVQTDRYVVLGANPKWQPIAALFGSYANQKADTINDWSLSTLYQYVPAPSEPGRQPPCQDCDPLPPLQLDDTCATQRPMDRYTLTMILSGIAQPKAVLADDAGNRCKVVRGDGIGSEGGRVLAVTQYKVVVGIPGREKPVVLSIAPPIAPENQVSEAMGYLP